MRIHYLLLLAILCAGLSAGEDLVNTYKLDSNGQSYQLTLKDNWGFELTGPNGQQVSGTYVASDRKIGLLAGKLLRHFEYKVQNGDLLLRPSTTDGPEPNDVLGQMPPVKRDEAFTAYLTSAHHKQKYALQPVAQPPVKQQPITQPVVTNQPLTMDQLLTQARMDSQYHAYMAAGTKALSEKKFPEARAHFILASRFKPDAPGARDHIALCDGAQALAEGDTARKRGDLRTAHHAYTRAKQTCPALSKIADAQLGTIRVFHPGARRSFGRRHTTELDRNIAQHVEQGRSADALQLATNALRSDPNSLRLRTMKEGLEGLQPIMVAPVPLGFLVAFCAVYDGVRVRTLKQRHQPFIDLDQHATGVINDIAEAIGEQNLIAKPLLAPDKNRLARQILAIPDDLRERPQTADNVTPLKLHPAPPQISGDQQRQRLTGVGFRILGVQAQGAAMPEQRLVNIAVYFQHPLLTDEPANLWLNRRLLQR